MDFKAAQKKMRIFGSSDQYGDESDRFATGEAMHVVLLDWRVCIFLNAYVSESGTRWGFRRR